MAGKVESIVPLERIYNPVALTTAIVCSIGSSFFANFLSL